MARRIVEKTPDEVLKQDLEKYRRLAIELGAADAKVLPASQVIIDDRVRAKCIYPKCRRYGTNANCPPYAMDLDQMRRVVAGFHYAVFHRIEVPMNELVGPDSKDIKIFTSSFRKNHEIVSRIEAAAFQDGHHLALGFAGGSCKSVFCPDKDCTAIMPGKGCSHPLKARSAMEAVGMDAFTMAARVGWEVYPIGSSMRPEDAPRGCKLGIVLIC